MIGLSPEDEAEVDELPGAIAPIQNDAQAPVRDEGYEEWAAALDACDGLQDEQSPTIHPRVS